ncbi:unnamed protein product [Fraxinus pennsylvanica]|uniref:Uncharacterized protein n=1 Tax=Fraxinus pennsylvanica TaxID=56036 RepID=A0AAD2DR80_9LAMI|nr:unnamed protein product [Fraxinus pennsylvanica]
MSDDGEEERAMLEFTPTWVAAAVCTIIVAISLAAEHLLYYAGKVVYCSSLFHKHLLQGLLSAMNQLPDKAIALAAASHIERELQITPWNLSSNFVACTKKNEEKIDRLEITGSFRSQIFTHFVCYVRYKF